MHNLISILNTQSFEFLNNAAGYYHPLDLFFVFITSYVTMAFVGVAVLVYFVFYLPAKAEEGWLRIQAFKNAWKVIVGVFLAWLFTNILKVIVAFPRPFQTLKHLHVLVSLPESYSFPSAHAAVTMALATGVYFYRRRLGELLFIFAFAVGLARIYVGVHYPLDVGVGFLIGYLIPKLLHIKREVVK
ncbi:MAG TPA: phosphatase PAP2 family protein [Candidatus Paceibacterota bacterium]|nr:phosphatase PAP2 family protein [Candidatus Paceibacterota bacterium]